MAKLVLYTFGIFQQPRDHEQIKGFHDRNPFVYTSAENSDGFVDRSGNSWKRDHADRETDWGTREVSPRFLTSGEHRDAPPPFPCGRTLSRSTPSPAMVFTPRC